MEESSLITVTNKATTQGTQIEPILEENKRDRKILHLFRMGLAHTQLSQKYS